MKGPKPHSENTLWLDEVSSTQEVAAQILLASQSIDVVVARHQTAGKGRLGREWVSRQGESLCASLILRPYADHPHPYLVGMAVALAAAGAFRTQVRWPNDLVIGVHKVGGVLTEMLPDAEGLRVPVVGIGVNLNQHEFAYPLDDIATSLKIAYGQETTPEAALETLLRRIELLPEPDDWSLISPIWGLFDRTPGKQYRLTTGELAIALGVGSDAQLICSVNGESRAAVAAEAIFGRPETA